MRRERPWLATLVWLGISFLTLFPIYWLFVISVKPAVELFSTPEVLLTSFYWANYAEALTDVTLRRYAKPEEIASVIEFLLDNTRSGYMTGEIVAVDGGFRGAGIMVER